LKSSCSETSFSFNLHLLRELILRSHHKGERS
jgi:hypothetical protein